jgi:apolipoprotein N-acyltransferase
MRRNPWHAVGDLLSAGLAAALVALSFPDSGLGWLAWVGLVPLFGVLCRRGPWGSFFLAHACGMLIIVGGFRWILEVGRYTALHHAVLVVFFGAYLGLFGLGFSLIGRWWGLTAAFAVAPFLWVALEYLKSNLGFLALPWLLLAHSQYAYPPVIQAAAVTGAHGISFLIVLVNAAIAMAAVAGAGGRMRGLFPPAAGRPSGRAAAGMVACAALLAAAALLYGRAKLAEASEGPGFRVAVVQGNIAQERKWDRQHAEDILAAYEELSRRALAGRPDLIVWPETATPGAISRDRRLNARLHRLAGELAVPLLVGSSQQRKFGAPEDAGPERRNSAYLIPAGRDGVRHQRYDKIRLLPFGEYLPLKETLPWEAIDIADVGGYAAGGEFTVFEISGVRFAVTICWENIFPDLVRQFVRNGARFIINITNEAWFGKTAAPYQFLSMSVFRAVENGVYVARCANTGVSGFIDRRGRVYARVADPQGEGIFVRGVLTEPVATLGPETFYTRQGDWFAWVAVAASIAGLGSCAFRRRAPSRWRALRQEKTPCCPPS